MKAKKLLTKEEAAELLRLTPIAVYRKAQRREIPFYKVGRLLRFDEAELIEWASKNPREVLNG